MRRLNHPNRTPFFLRVPFSAVIFVFQTEQVSCFEVTWLGLHAFHKVFGAFSAKHKGFSRPVMDMAEALRDVESGKKSETEKKETSRSVDEGGRGGNAEKSKARRVEAVQRLRRVVCNPDALRLLHTLTTDATDVVK